MLMEVGYDLESTPNMYKLLENLSMNTGVLS
jgi:hypothetical protein